jgi:type IV pilus assembly protein PilO
MRRNFERLRINSNLSRQGPGFWLRGIGVVLALLNCVALFLYLDPPGGTQRELTEQSLQVRNEIAATRRNATRLKTVAANVQLGNTQSSAFESIYFLPRRTAYQRVIGELQRMAAASGLQEGDRVYSEEPIEGTADLTLLNIAANNYQGTYDNLMHFLYEVDKSPMLLMLDTLLAAPQQTGGRVNSSLRFQAVIQEEASPVLGGQP